MLMEFETELATYITEETKGEALVQEIVDRMSWKLGVSPETARKYLRIIVDKNFWDYTKVKRPGGRVVIRSLRVKEAGIEAQIHTAAKEKLKDLI